MFTAFRLRLDFHDDMFSILSEVNRLPVLLLKLQTVLSKDSILTIYKTFIRPHLNYNDAIQDKIYNEHRHKMLELTQFSAALAIKGAILGTNTLKPYQKLCLESLQNRRKSRRLSLFYKFHKNQSSLYLYKIIPAKTPGN